MEFVDVTDAARRLDVTTRQVQHLAARGELRLVARGLIDRTSLDRHLATRQGSRRRAWSQTTAWGAVAILSGRDATWIGQTQRSRLKATLRRLSPAELLSHARNRAQVHHFQGHLRTVERLRSEVVDTASTTTSLGLGGTDRVDGYVDADDLDSVVARHALTESADGRFILRATSIGLDIVRDLAEAGHVLASLDLAESLDVRERQAGMEGLDVALRRLRD